MPRAARIKDESAVYHIMARSISEFNLFQCDEDKEYYLDLLKKYKEKFKCKIYGYCLMSNHLHLHIDPCGFDISKFMHCLNLAYVRYINIKYNRKGHLFAERFQSKIINDMNYNLLVSAYIHNNPFEIKDYKGREYEYKHSSMGIYTGEHNDFRKLVDVEFVLSCIDEKNKNSAKKQYIDFVFERKDLEMNNKLKEYIYEFEKDKYSKRYCREVYLRDKDPQFIINYLSTKFKISNPSKIMKKWHRKSVKFRAIVVYTLNVLCGLSYKEICKIMYNISESCCARLCNKGYEFLENGSFEKEIFQELLSMS